MIDFRTIFRIQRKFKQDLLALIRHPLLEFEKHLLLDTLCAAYILLVEIFVFFCIFFCHLRSTSLQSGWRAALRISPPVPLQVGQFLGAGHQVRLSKNKIPVLGNAIYLFWGTKTGVIRILVIFQDRPMFSHIIQKVSARAFH